MKEQKKQDAVLNRIGQLLRDLNTHNTTAAISIFQLPPDRSLSKGGEEWKKSGGVPPSYFETEEPPYCVGPYKLGDTKPTKDYLVGVQYWIRVDDAMLITSDRLLSVLALILLPQEINPREQKVASRLLDIVLKQKDKIRSNWSKFLRLRGAWNDQDEAKGWVDNQNMLDFSWNDVKNPTRFGVDFGQSMDPSEVRKEQREAKYWWIDIPDLTGLVLKILPTLEKQREKELLDGMTKTEAVVWELKKDIAHCKFPHNTSNRELAVRYGCNPHTIEDAVAMLTEEERQLIPYGKESKKALKRSVRGITNMMWSANRMEENKIEVQRERLKKIYYESANLTREAAEDRVMAIEPDKLQEEIESCLDNL